MMTGPGEDTQKTERTKYTTLWLILIDSNFQYSYRAGLSDTIVQLMFINHAHDSQSM